MDVIVVSVEQRHIDKAIASRNWNGTPLLLSMREKGLGGSVGFRPTNQGGEPEYLHTDEIHPTLEHELPSFGGYAIRRGLYNWMTDYYRNWYKNSSDIKPVDVRLVKDGDNWYADVA